MVHSFMTWRGPDAANAVTDDASSGTPRSTASGSQGRPPSSSSATHHDSLPGCPSVERSSSPGRASSRLRNTSRTARPMQTLARSAPASAECADDMPSWVRIGPLTTSRMAHPPVDAVAPWTSRAGSHSAPTAAATTGKSTGVQPASTALTATFSATKGRDFTGSTPSTWSAVKAPHSSIAATRAGVGGTIGRPSLHPRASYSWRTASSSATR